MKDDERITISPWEKLYFRTGSEEGQKDWLPEWWQETKAMVERGFERFYRRRGLPTPKVKVFELEDSWENPAPLRLIDKTPKKGTDLT